MCSFVADDGGAIDVDAVVVAVACRYELVSRDPIGFIELPQGLAAMDNCMVEAKMDKEEVEDERELTEDKQERLEDAETMTLELKAERIRYIRSTGRRWSWGRRRRRRSWTTMMR